MSDLRGARIAVAGAGAVGAATALHLAERGGSVLLADPALSGDNASGVAAGMLAPVMEAVLDGASAGHLDLLRAARDAWPAFVAALESAPPIERCGALWIDEALGVPDQLARLSALGAAGEAVTAAQAPGLSPGLAAIAGVYTAEDWRLEPLAMLRALRAALVRRGGRVAQAAVVHADQGMVLLSNGERWATDWTVIACGHPSDLTLRLAPELALLSPIKGQIVRFEPGVAPSGGPLVRTAKVYVCPGAFGPAAGATMEAGVNDRRAEPAAAERLRADATALFPSLAHAPGQGLAAVRSATADGLPLVGPSLAPGVIIAAGARRNGWLLAPLIAGVVADHAGGGCASAAGAAFDPRRFDGAPA